MFERMFVESGTTVTKLWFSVTQDEQRTRFAIRQIDPVRRWKLSPMDVESYSRWYDYSRARDDMLEATDVPHARWNILDSNNKRRARLNGIANILSLIPYDKPKDDKVKLPKRSKKHAYDDVIKPAGRTFVPQNW